MSVVAERAALLRVLADPTRLRLLEALRTGDLTVAEITRVTGLSQPRVSRHLKLLSEAGLLARTPDQNEAYYRLAPTARQAPLVHLALDGLRDCATQRQDHRRLAAILDQRRDTARRLLERLGVRPLGPGTRQAVEATIGELLLQPLRTPDLGTLLDVGTGTGTMLGLLGPHVQSAIAIDASREMRIVARANMLAAGLANCCVQAGDMYALGFESGCFDLVTMDRVLGASEQPGQAVLEAGRVLRPGGRLLIVETTGAGIDADRLEGWSSRAGLSLCQCRTAGDAALIALSQRPLA